MKLCQIYIITYRTVKKVVIYAFGKFTLVTHKSLKPRKIPRPAHMVKISKFACGKPCICINNTYAYCLTPKTAYLPST